MLNVSSPHVNLLTLYISDGEGKRKKIIFVKIVVFIHIVCTTAEAHTIACSTMFRRSRTQNTKMLFASQPTSRTAQKRRSDSRGKARV